MALSHHHHAFWDWDAALDPVTMQLTDQGKRFSMDVGIPYGFSKDDLKLTVADDILTLSGRKSSDEKTDTSETHSYSSFSRSIRLPNLVNQEEITAGMRDHHILHVDLPKKDARKAVAFDVPVSLNADVSKRDKLDKKFIREYNVGAPEDKAKSLEQRMKQAEEHRKKFLEEQKAVAGRVDVQIAAAKDRKQEIDKLKGEFGAPQDRSANQ
jgi:HSP20 family molecular chaperone IbpA